MRGRHPLRLVKVERVGQILEDPDGLGPLVGRRLHLDGVDLHHLVEGQREDELLVAVALQVPAAGAEGVAVGVVVALVEALALGSADELEQVLLRT